VGFAEIPLYQEPWGKDSGMKMASPQDSPKRYSMAVQIAHSVIRFHQEVLSPVDGPRSSFRPSSSEYMKRAMMRYGFLTGYFMGCDRLLRENSEKWVYRTVDDNGQIFKYDPAQTNKYSLEALHPQ
jgi:putative component of membrane protein insertase Oxa1/YidC/SpoIIIJ protein YidD